jgi:hypothetical protein
MSHCSHLRSAKMLRIGTEAIELNKEAKFNGLRICVIVYLDRAEKIDVELIDFEPMTSR